MRVSFLLASASLVLTAAAAAACVASGDDGVLDTGLDGDAGASPPDTETIVVDAGDAGDALDTFDGGDGGSDEGPACSRAGWCATDLPAPDLLMKYIWPFAGRAFVAAESPTLGVKILEWDQATAKWAYVDDGTQNSDGLGAWVGDLWAPSENELYFGVAPNYIYHGIRPAPGEPFVWTRQQIGTSTGVNDGNPQYSKRDAFPRVASLGIWGTSADDVYAWFKSAIYHWTSVDGEPPAWVREYIATDVASGEEIYVLGAAGSGPDDVWFTGGRSRGTGGCAFLLHKTSAGYTRVADGTLASAAGGTCTVRRGSKLIGGAEGWLTDLQMVSPTELIALKGARDVVRISLANDDVSVTSAPVPTTLSAKALNSVISTADTLWLGGAGMVVRGSFLADGGSEFEISTIAVNDLPINQAIYQVRGTNTNLWAIGVRNALHKSTP